MLSGAKAIAKSASGGKQERIKISELKNYLKEKLIA